jgi:hypothetical protein
LLPRTDTNAQSPSAALPMAIPIARIPTIWPMPSSPSTTAVVRVSRTTLIVGRGLITPARMRST